MVKIEIDDEEATVVSGCGDSPKTPLKGECMERVEYKIIARITERTIDKT